MGPEEQLPLVYSCSGASSAAQMANHIAVKLDRLRAADMSCIAGVGGDVKSLLRTAKSGRRIIVLDGCPLHCAARILKRHGIKADKHHDLSKMGVTKTMHQDFDLKEASLILEQIVKGLPPPDQKTSRPQASPAKGNAHDATVPTGQEDAKFANPPCYLSEFKDW